MQRQRCADRSVGGQDARRATGPVIRDEDLRQPVVGIFRHADREAQRQGLDLEQLGRAAIGQALASQIITWLGSHDFTLTGVYNVVSSKIDQRPIQADCLFTNVQARGLEPTTGAA